ncbi:STAS domain-containing protein [Saccharothrix sp. AJ9571]|nr:STAS domain-containing protein [Saccharothrix sp. AJ9571]
MSDPAIPADQQLRISVSAHSAGVVLLAAAGAVDALTDTQLATALDQAWAQSPDLVLLDLADVPFLGSSGLSLLVDAHHQAQSNNARLAICAPSRPVQRAIEVTALDRILAIHPSTTAALEDLA